MIRFYKDTPEWAAGNRTFSIAVGPSKTGPCMEELYDKDTDLFLSTSLRTGPVDYWGVLDRQLIPRAQHDGGPDRSNGYAFKACSAMAGKQKRLDAGGRAVVSWGFPLFCLPTHTYTHAHPPTRTHVPTPTPHHDIRQRRVRGPRGAGGAHGGLLPAHPVLHLLPHRRPHARHREAHRHARPAHGVNNKPRQAKR